MILYDEPIHWKNLLPLTFTRSIAECRIGILTIQEKWEKYLSEEAQIRYSEDYLANGDVSGELHIVSNALPTASIAQEVKSLKKDQCLVFGDRVIAYRNALTLSNRIECSESLKFIEYPWHFFLYNDEEIRKDYKLLTAGRTSATMSDTNRVIGNEVFLEAGAKVSCAILNSETGPIYIASGAEIMEGSMIRGPFALGESAQVKMGAKIYGATTFGPGCKVGGEVTNCILFANSNKAHDGYIGNAVIGEWCNLGADTNSSNLKNNYSPVEIFNYTEGKAISTDQLFCGLIMGDHSKVGINTMFNTGTVVGVSANIVGSGFPSKHIPSFSWSINEKIRAFDIEKALETARVVFERRGKKMNEREERILRAVKEMSVS
jgi:UDP-N-acetylglucosamine diphosphorylase/glucosamine-1-phosphate N-acetyltransferase